MRQKYWELWTQKAQFKMFQKETILATELEMILWYFDENSDFFPLQLQSQL